MGEMMLFSAFQRNEACEYGLLDCVPLAKADLSRPFVYERRFGVFYVPAGRHLLAMSLLLALQNECETGVEVACHLKLEYPGDTADCWLKNTPGAAFKSSVGKRIQVATGRGLTALERRLFGEFERVF